MKMYVLNKVNNNINLLLKLMIIKFFGKILLEKFIILKREGNI
ncbi:hypothetical protein THA_1055 [Thermosipho africanus TCF52B]|jgi:hypothetical protein|uniref:Uncharacterized protein n=1 Tax=Thermosipho africanus (strain TCF52B) TaxID=484019 RepID=B7IHE7_THEAB|nr:hypothetical protein THA_1055 [Thermosipho africanus TCF52B]